MIAGVMEAMNALNEQNNEDVWTEGYWILSAVLEPIVPHIAWEVSTTLFERNNLNVNAVKEEVFSVDSVTLGAAVNGKRRAEIEVSPSASKDEIIATAKEALGKWLEDKEIVKEIVVPNKLVNIVVKG